MNPRTNYEMTEADLEKILDAGKPTPCIMVGSYTGRTPQENANRAWAELGTRMGFDSMTVRPIDGKGSRHFTAVPTENEAQRKERLELESKADQNAEIKRLEQEIQDRQTRLNVLRG